MVKRWSFCPFQIDRIVNDHITNADMTASDVASTWTLVASEGDMKVYKREVEDNAAVIYPLKAVHTVKVRLVASSYYFHLRFCVIFVLFASSFSGIFILFSSSFLWHLRFICFFVLVRSSLSEIQLYCNSWL